MASITLQVGAEYITGTTVSVFHTVNSVPVKPVGDVVTTGVVGSDGAVTFGGLLEGVNYLAYSSTGTPAYVQFYVPTAVAGSGGSLTPTAVKTADYTAITGDLVRVDTTSGPVTVTLPPAVLGATAGVKLVTLGGSNAVTVAAAVGDVFNKAGGVSSVSLTLLNQGVVLSATTGVWVVQADDLALSQLDARYPSGVILPFQATHAYVAGQAITQFGQTYTRNSAGTSRASFDATEKALWTALPTNVPRGFLATQLEGAHIYVDGHSIPAGSGVPFSTMAFPAKIQNRLNFGSMANHSTSGWTSAKIIAGNIPYTGGYLPGGTPGFGVFWDGMANDMGQGGAAAKALAKFTNALTTYALFLRARMDGYGTLAVDGNWSADTSHDSLGTGAGYHTTTQNAVATITTLLAGGKAMILLMGIDDATNDTGAGATYTITTQSDSVAETTVATGTTSNQFFKGSDVDGRAYMPVVVDVATGANPLVKVKKSDAGSTVLHIVSPNPGRSLVPINTAGIPLGVFIKQPYVPAYVANATNDIYRAIQLSVLTSVLGPEGAAWLLVDVDAEGFNSTLHTADSLHPNTIGHSLYAQAIVRAMTRITFLP